MISILRKTAKNKILRYTVTALFWLAVWQFGAETVGKEVLLPSPRATFAALYGMLKTWDFYLFVLKSIGRVMAGYLIGIVLGVILAVISHFSGFAKMILSPLKSIIKATPVASFIILAYMWLKKSEIPGVIGAMIVVPIIWGNVEGALDTIDKKQLECGALFDLPPIKKLKYIYLPHVKPFFIAGALTGVGLAWKSGIAAETLVNLKNSIGGMLYDYKNYLESDKLFALTAVVIILSMLIEKLFVGFFGKKEGRKNGKV